MPTPDDIEMDLLHHLKSVNTELVLALKGTILLVELKYGNMDPNANQMLTFARAAIKKVESQS